MKYDSDHVDAIYEEVSAFLDGECDDVERIARRIETDPRYQQAYAEVGAVSKAMGRLEAPQIDSAFRARVLAALTTGGRERTIRWRWYAVPLAAAAMLLIAGSLWMLNREEAVVPAPQSTQWRLADLDALENELAAIAGQNSEAVLASADLFVGDPEVETPVQMALSTFMEDVYSDSWWDRFLKGAADEQEIEALINGLDMDETAALREMLVAYASEGWQS